MLSIDFGPEGIGGDRNSTVGDGFYQLLFDVDGDGDFETTKSFYRLLGHVNGDRVVDNQDINRITAALGRTGPGLEEDINGDGVVNSLDRTLAIRSRGRKLAEWLWVFLDD